jgi:hypothetical protein
MLIIPAPMSFTMRHAKPLTGTWIRIHLAGWTIVSPVEAVRPDVSPVSPSPRLLSTALSWSRTIPTLRERSCTTGDWPQPVPKGLRDSMFPRHPATA